MSFQYIKHRSEQFFAHSPHVTGYSFRSRTAFSIAFLVTTLNFPCFRRLSRTLAVTSAVISIMGISPFFESYTPKFRVSDNDSVMCAIAPAAPVFFGVITFKASVFDIYRFQSKHPQIPHFDKTLVSYRPIIRKGENDHFLTV